MRFYTQNVVEGKRVTVVQRQVWRPDDDRIIRGASIQGRAIVDLEGGGRSHGLVLVPLVPLGQLAPLVAVVFERSTGRFVAVDVPRDGKP